MGVMTIRGEVGNLTVTVAGDILDGGVTGWALIQTLERHNREYLVDGPRVAEALEEREVAEIFISQELVDLHQLLGDMLQTFGKGMDLVTHAPVHGFHLGTGLQVDDTMREEVEYFFTNLLSIVPVFQHIAWREIVPDFIEVLH